MVAAVPGNDLFGLGMAVVGNTVVFAINALDGMSATLWKSDGTSAGTIALKTFNGFSFRGLRAPLAAGVVGNQLVFVVDDGIHGVELWKSDLTAAGTVLLKDVQPGNLGSFPGNLVNVSGTIYFSADDGVTGNELWSTDGTEAGTVLRGDLMPGGAGSNPSPVVPMGGKLFFAATEYHVGRELWTYSPK